MMPQRPLIDGRNASQISKQIDQLLSAYVPEHEMIQVDPQTGVSSSDQLTQALVGISARFCELIIQRLNRVPDKNFLAFLNLLGESLLPPQPAQTYLTFTMVPASTTQTLVPRRTQVAAIPTEGETEPIIFETDRELVVTAAQLRALYSREPAQDLYTEHITATSPADPHSASPIFRGNRRIVHDLYLGHNTFFSYPSIETVTLNITLTEPISAPLDSRELRWEIWDGQQGLHQTPSIDSTANLTQNGNTVFARFVDSFPEQTVQSITSRWLRCRLQTPISQSIPSREGMVRVSQLPTIADVSVEVMLKNDGLSVEAGFTNSLTLDLTKDFYPFGEKPKRGDVFYLAHKEAFSIDGATITLDIDVEQPGATRGMPELIWEFYNGETNRWHRVENLVDGTHAFTMQGQNTVQFDISATGVLAEPKSTIVNGIDNFWIRVRIVSGNYGEESTYILREPQFLFKSAFTNTGELDEGKVPSTLQEEFANQGISLSQSIFAHVVNKGQHWQLIDNRNQQTFVLISNEEGALNVSLQREGYELVPATFAPPLLNSVDVGYTATKMGPPESILVENDFMYGLIQGSLNEPVTPFRPFLPTQDARPTFYLGFLAPQGQTTFPNHTVTLFSQVADFKYGDRLVPVSPLCSQSAGEPGAVIVHSFLLTNDLSVPMELELKTLGTQWPTTLNAPPKLTLAPNEIREVEVEVTVPTGLTHPGDEGFLRLRDANDSMFEHSATFATFVGQVPVDEELQLAWQYWNGADWSTLTVQDEGENFTRNGLVQFLAPADFMPDEQFGLDGYWLRVRWERGRYQHEPRLHQLLLNTTLAMQTTTLHNETLGSSDGSEDQVLQSLKTPVLTGQQLEVREPEQPSEEERLVIQSEEGADAISSTQNSIGIWVRWHQVSDFYASGPRDRHYTLNHLTGEIQFGNGLNGLIPPPGSGNIRLAIYQSGGGTAGNKATHSIVQLKTSVPYIDQVTNPIPAEGGAEAEAEARLFERAPLSLRHRGRATTVEDIQDIARLASPAVARSQSVPLRNLLVDPLGIQPETLGEVSLIIAPYSEEAKPQPSLSLIERVKDYLTERSDPNINISVVGPLYIGVQVKAEVAMASLEGTSAIQQAIYQRLNQFLHPLTGGPENEGWDFGRLPHRSDLLALLEGIPGVDHVRSLSIDEIADESSDLLAVKQSGYFLVYSASHEVNLVFTST